MRLSVAALLSLLPATAFAAGGPPSRPPVVPKCVDRSAYERQLDDAAARMPAGKGDPVLFRRAFSILAASTFNVREALESDAEKGDVNARDTVSTNYAECLLDGYPADAAAHAKKIDWLQSAAKRKTQARRALGNLEALGWAGNPASLERAYPLLFATTDAEAVGTGNENARREAVFAAVLKRLLAPRISSASTSILKVAGGEHPYPVLLDVDECRPALVVKDAPDVIDSAALQHELDQIVALLPRVPPPCIASATLRITLYGAVR